MFPSNPLCQFGVVVLFEMVLLWWWCTFNVQYLYLIFTLFFFLSFLPHFYLIAIIWYLSPPSIRLSFYTCPSFYHVVVYISVSWLVYLSNRMMLVNHMNTEGNTRDVFFLFFASIWMLYSLLVVSCDEYMIKKIVSLQKIQTEIKNYFNFLQL